MKKHKLSLSRMITILVVFLVTIFLLWTTFLFLSLYTTGMKENAKTTSEQAVVQASNAIANYIEDMQDIMSMVQNSFTTSTEEQKKTLEMLCRVRSDLVAIYIYNEEGSLTDSYTGGRSMKQNCLKDLSYISREYYNPRTLYLSEPHVESMLQDYYPWVVSVLQETVEKR